MTDFVATAAFQRRGLRRCRCIRYGEFGPDHRRNTRGNALGPQKQVEMAVLGLSTIFGVRVVAMIEILRVTARIVDFPVGIAAPFGNGGCTIRYLVEDRSSSRRKCVAALADNGNCARSALRLVQAPPPPAI